VTQSTHRQTSRKQLPHASIPSRVNIASARSTCFSACLPCTVFIEQSLRTTVLMPSAASARRGSGNAHSSCIFDQRPSARALPQFIIILLFTLIYSSAAVSLPSSATFFHSHAGDQFGTYLGILLSFNRWRWYPTAWTSFSQYILNLSSSHVVLRLSSAFNILNDLFSACDASYFLFPFVVNCLKFLAYDIVIEWGRIICE
jgi:hypothetical protein